MHRSFAVLVAALAILAMACATTPALPGPTNEGAGESRSRYQHGEAVAMGMVAATRLAVDIGRCDATVFDRLVALLDRVGLPTSSANLADTDVLLDAMRVDKKVADGQLRLVLPVAVGHVTIAGDTPNETIRNAWDAVRVT